MSSTDRALAALTRFLADDMLGRDLDTGEIILAKIEGKTHASYLPHDSSKTAIVGPGRDSIPLALTGLAEGILTVEEMYGG